jgi:hypothetical protein
MGLSCTALSGVGRKPQIDRPLFAAPLQKINPMHLSHDPAADFVIGKINLCKHPVKRGG